MYVETSNTKYNKQMNVIISLQWVGPLLQMSTTVLLSQ